MNEGIKGAIEITPNPEFDQSVVVKKMNVLNMLVAAGRSDDQNQLGITELELLTTTPSSEWDTLRQALDQLVYGGHVDKTSFTPYENGVFVGYELADDIPASLPFAISAGTAIKQRLEQLESRIGKDGIASLAADEWALVPILRTAHEQGMRGTVQGDELQVNLIEIHHKLLDDLHDEGVEKWHRAFVGAVKQARILFQSQD